MINYPQYFVRPKSLYMASVLKEFLEMDKNIVAFVGSIHYNEIRDRLKDKIYYKGLSLNRFLGENTRPNRESNSDRVKKMAIIDNLLDVYPWIENHILNPFCYITENPGELTINEMNSFKSEYLR